MAKNASGTRQASGETAASGRIVVIDVSTDDARRLKGRKGSNLADVN